jgi:CRP/FNR family transcriptional regulator
VSFAAIEHPWKGPSQCEYCQIRNIAVFSALGHEDFALIHDPIYEYEFAKGETLYQANEPGKYLFTVREGIIKLVDYSPSGGERIVRLLRRGDVVGLEALLGHPYQHNAVALNATLTCSIPINVINKLSELVPDFHRQLLNHWQRAVNEADLWLAELGTGAVKTRLARLLIHLTEAESSSTCFIPSRKEIGSMMGVTTETVSRAAAELKRAGLIRNVGMHKIKISVDGLRPFVE